MQITKIRNESGSSPSSPPADPDKSSSSHTGHGPEPRPRQSLLWPRGSVDPSTTHLQNFFWLCWTLQPCPWKPTPQLACTGTCVLGQLQEQTLVRGTYAGVGLTQWFRDLPRGFGGYPGEVEIGCSSLWGQGY